MQSFTSRRGRTLQSFIFYISIFATRNIDVIPYFIFHGILYTLSCMVYYISTVFTNTLNIYLKDEQIVALLAIGRRFTNR